MREQLKGGVRGGHSVVASGYPVSQVQHADDFDDLDGRDHWPKGLTNVGNTCYANATLQCLLSTALTNALLDPQTIPLFRRYSSNPNLLAMGSGSVDSDEENVKNPKSDCENEKSRKEREKRRLHENCEWLTKELTVITQDYTAVTAPSHPRGSSVMGWLSQTQTSEVVVNPGSITKHPDRLSNCLRPYQQEDAHEFLRALLSTLVMNGHNKQLSSLFDGLLESSVTCRTCGRASLTRDRYMDLSLDINDPDICTLDDALYEYTKTEILDEENAVLCAKCKRKRSVTKGLRLATAPSILVCHLKRFAFDNYGRLVRLHKKINFPLRLEIEDFMSNLNKARPPPYDLVGILVHQGQTCASGHYLAFVKKHGEWYRCNDSTVTKVDEATVLNQQAYILMYEVAEMRERTCTPRSKLRKQLSLPVVYADDPELDKDDYTRSTHASSCRTGDRSGYSAHTRESSAAPVERILNFLSEAESGITRFLADLCCDNTNNGVNEPKTCQMKRRDRRGARDEDSIAAMRRSFSSEGVKVIEVERSKSGYTHRSQTAPRQRRNSDSYEPGFSMDSPHSTYSARSEKLYRQQKAHERDPRDASRSKRERSRSIHTPREFKGLPPLPQTGRRRRATSNASIRRKDGYIV
jgi:hypothetical protein